LAPERADEVAEDLIPVIGIEALERRHGHRFHHLLKRAQASRCENRAVRVAVLGHVEWIDFVRVERVPLAGEIITATETWAEPAGGGAVAAVQLARLAGSSTFFTALGDDDLGRRSQAELEALGVRVRAVFRPEPQRRALTYVDAAGERTITVIHEKMRPRPSEPLPWGELASFDAVYFCAGAPEALQAARVAPILVATARELPTLAEAGVELDALVASAHDPSERYRAGDLDPEPRLVVRTAGAAGGSVEPGGGTWAAAPVPNPIADTYGAGDSFAAGLTYALGAGLSLEDGLRLAARCGAEALSRRGAHGV
jgi:ribokinase